MHHFLLIALVFVTSTAMPAEVTGTARVLDGDTIKLDTVTVRLHGIDAPENGQDCTRSNRKSYNCGEKNVDSRQKQRLLDTTVFEAILSQIGIRLVFDSD